MERYTANLQKSLRADLAYLINRYFTRKKHLTFSVLSKKTDVPVSTLKRYAKSETPEPKMEHSCSIVTMVADHDEQFLFFNTYYKRTALLIKNMYNPEEVEVNPDLSELLCSLPFYIVYNFAEAEDGISISVLEHFEGLLKMDTLVRSAEELTEAGYLKKVDSRFFVSQKSIMNFNFRQVASIFKNAIEFASMTQSKAHGVYKNGGVNKDTAQTIHDKMITHEKEVFALIDDPVNKGNEIVFVNYIKNTVSVER